MFDETKADNDLPPGFMQMLAEVSPKYDDYMGRSPARVFYDSPKVRKAKKKKRKAAKKARRKNRR